MDGIAAQLDDETGGFGSYRQLASKYRVRRENMLVDSSAPSGIAPILTSASVRLGLGAAKSVPGIAGMLEGIEPDVAAEQTEKVRSYLAKQFRKTADGELLLNPVRTLTVRFLADLRRVAIGYANVVFAVDTFERRSDRVQRWLVSVLNGEFGMAPRNLVLIISGQHPLDANVWAGFNHVTERFTLKEFSEFEVSTPLRALGATSNDAAPRVMQITGGLPVLVGMLGKKAGDLEQTDDDTAETAVERFLKYEQDADRRNLILQAAVARWLDAQTLGSLVGEGSEQEVLAWLSTFPFVKKQGDKWIFHGVVRTMMVRYQRDRAPDHQKRIHSTLFKYHSNIVEQLWKSHTPESAGKAREHELEKFYHGLCAGDDNSILSDVLTNIILRVRNKNPFGKRLVAALSDAANDLPSTTCEGLHETIAPIIESDAIKSREEVYSVVINSGHLKDVDLALAYHMRASLRIFELDAFELGIYDCNKSISYFRDDENVARGVRAYAYQKLGRFDECMEDLNWCLKQNPDDPYILSRRHELHRQLGNIEDAERDITAAVESDTDATYYRVARANLLYETLRDDEAFVEYTKVVELDGGNTDIRRRAEAYRFARRYNEALADYETLIKREIDPQDLVRRGELLRLLGNPEGALPDALRGAAGDDVVGWAYVSIGLIYRDLHQSSRAIDSFQEAVQVGLSYLQDDKNSVPALFNTAMAYAALGDDTAAMRQLRDLEALGINFMRVRQAQALYQELLDAGVVQGVSIERVLEASRDREE
jgi:tetratricopeptide (TPR) repeat protein